MERLEQFPAPLTSRYDWDQILNGDVWKLKHGDDFTASPKTFIASARTQARRRAGKVRTRLFESEGAVVVQFQAVAPQS